MAKKKKVVATTTVDPPKCPKGYYWDGTKCILDVG